jgi:predicted DNA-binding transcriptional regulator AlpA
MTPRLQDQLNYPPRLMRADRAAAYLDMSRSAFLRLVAQKVLPPPVKHEGLVRWDRLKLDAAVEDLETVETIKKQNSFDAAMEKWT